MVTQLSQTRANILAAASQAVLVAGGGGLRIDAVAQSAKVNKRMIYHYFEHKEGLIRAVYGLYARRMVSGLNALSEESREIFGTLLGGLPDGLLEQTPDIDPPVSTGELRDAMQLLLPVLMRNEAGVAALKSISSDQWRIFSKDVMNMIFAGIGSKVIEPTKHKPRFRMASTSRIR